MQDTARLPQRFLTVRDTAAELSTSDDTIWRLIRRGELPVVRIPGPGRRAVRVLVPRDELESAIKRWGAA